MTIESHFQKAKSGLSSVFFVKAYNHPTSFFSKPQKEMTPEIQVPPCSHTKYTWKDFLYIVHNLVSDTNPQLCTPEQQILATISAISMTIDHKIKEQF